MHLCIMQTSSGVVVYLVVGGHESQMFRSVSKYCQIVQDVVVFKSVADYLKPFQDLANFG